MTDHELILAIQTILNGQVWNADTLQDIAYTMQKADYEISEPKEE